MGITRRDSFWTIGIIIVVTACGGIVDDASSDPSTGGSDGEQSPRDGARVGNGAELPSAAPPSATAASCDVDKPFVVEDLHIEGRSPSVTRDETILVYVDNVNAYESKRTPGNAFGAGTPFYGPTAIDAVISPDGLRLDHVYYAADQGEARAAQASRASTDVPFAMIGTTPAVPGPSLAVWRAFNVGTSTYYADKYHNIHVVRAGVDSTIVEKPHRWFAVSEDDLVFHYGTIGNAPPFESTMLVARRASPSVPFGAPKELPELAIGDGWMPIHVTWVSTDDCVVYGWSSKWDVSKNGEKLGLFRAQRGK